MDVGMAGKPSILIVDDDELWCLFCARAVAEEGYDTRWVLSTSQAMTVLEEPGPVNLILVDWMLPPPLPSLRGKGPKGPHRTARDLIEWAQALRPGLGVLCMSAHPLERLVAM